MGTGMRFVAGVAGLVLFLTALALMGSILGEVIADPYDIDLPGGPLLPVAMGLLVGAAPFALGFVLLRKAFRGGGGTTAIVSMATVAPPVRPMALEPLGPAAIAVAAVTAPTLHARDEIDEVRPATEATEPDVPMTPQNKRRPWLAVLGLGLALVGLLIEFGAVASSVSNAFAPAAGGVAGLILFMMIAAIPLALGLWLAHIGDPGIGRRFMTDLGGGLSALRSPSTLKALLRTSIGLAFVIAMVSLPLILIAGQASILVALGATTLFAAVDPLFNFTRRSWWLGAILSAGSWLALFAILSAAADKVAPMREGAMVFMLPMMIFGGAIALSGFARLWIWAVHRATG